MFQPIFDLLFDQAFLKMYRAYQKKKFYNDKKISATSKRNVQNDLLKFLDLHAGPEYAFYYKCSNANIAVFSCLIFGPCLPLLYGVGLLSILIQFLNDRLTLTYFYRLPPKYSEKLTIQCLRILSVVPIISLPFTFWIYTNQQMFANKIDPVESFD